MYLGVLHVPGGAPHVSRGLCQVELGVGHVPLGWPGAILGRPGVGGLAALDAVLLLQGVEGGVRGVVSRDVEGGGALQGGGGETAG